jgi:hypothetical protein
MVCTFARVGAAVTMKVEDDFMQGDLEPAAVSGKSPSMAVVYQDGFSRSQ